MCVCVGGGGEVAGIIAKEDRVTVCAHAECVVVFVKSDAAQCECAVGSGPE